MDRLLDRIEIRRFRGLSELSLDGLGRFNVLLGANDVGKTSVLEAIFLLCGFANLQLPFSVQNFRNLPTNEFDDFRTLFYRLDLHNPIHIVGHSSGHVVRRDLQISATYESSDFPVRAKYLSRIQDDDVKRNRKENDIVSRSATDIIAERPELRYDVRVHTGSEKNDSFSAIIYVEGDHFRVESHGNPRNPKTISGRFIGPRFAYETGVVGELIVRKKASHIVEYLRRINPKIRDIAVSEGNVFLDIGLDRMVPINAFGSGILRSTGILSYCMLGEQKVLLIDELRSGLHHTAIRPLLQTVLALSRGQNVQILATSHSLAILERLIDVLSEDEFLDYRDDTCCFALQRDDAGHIRSYRYEYDQFEHCVRHGIEIR
ncbi:MAG: AAA family ATPase [Bryobacterales bacterium]|nr:AAA family ATPase [Bryobacterales bacterium]